MGARAVPLPKLGLRLPRVGVGVVFCDVHSKCAWLPCCIQPPLHYLHLRVLNFCVMPVRCSVFTYFQMTIHSFLISDHHFKNGYCIFAIIRTLNFLLRVTATRNEKYEWKFMKI